MRSIIDCKSVCVCRTSVLSSLISSACASEPAMLASSRDRHPFFLGVKSRPLGVCGGAGGHGCGFEAASFFAAGFAFGVSFGAVPVLEDAPAAFAAASRADTV
eukprot:6261131-Alexandrium_andersonii.AAC.1